MRGKQRECGSCFFRVRLIPAGAGNIKNSIARACWCRAHPRGCGEHAFRYPGTHGSTSSSPRVRGTYRISEYLSGFLGLIPAGAGNIVSRRLLWLILRAHPRGCGEHELNGFTSVPAKGSSPRVRGTSNFYVEVTGQTGLIPAGAGNM